MRDETSATMATKAGSYFNYLIYYLLTLLDYFKCFQLFHIPIEMISQLVTSSNLQIVFEGVWGNSRVSGYIAVDDVTFFEGACTSKWII